jgi:EAL domain-containing protein (putative c-di-GMP-specific phosphodiesterase class I)
LKKSLLDTILDPRELSVRFQPIFRIGDGENEIHSVEALTRGPKGTNFESALLLFDYVRRKREERAVDQSCIAAICKEAAQLPPELRLNVNVHAATLGQSPGFVEALSRRAKKHSLSLDRFTVEIVEHAPTCDIPELAHTIADLRKAGVRIALDDVGLGHSNYRMMIDCHPEYFKLDAYFVKNLEKDSKRRAVVESVVAFGRALRSSVVAEGVETTEDVAILADLGVEFVQSNLFCPALTLEELRTEGFIRQAPFLVSQPAANRPSNRLSISAFHWDVGSHTH